MDVSPIDQINSIQKAANQQSPEAFRKIATQFEALLLMQLTSALNKTSDSDPEDGEDNLFGGDSGTGLAKQLFSEQLATTMAQSGGVGLADTIMRQIGGAPANKPVSGNLKGLSDAISAVKDIKREGSAEGLPLAAKAPRAMPLSKPGNPNEAEIISTFEDEARTDGVDASMRNLILDGKIVNTTRPRIAPNAAITMVQDVADTAVGAGSPSKPLHSVVYQSPVSGRLSSGFGNRFHPIDKKIKFHAGLDLAVPLGTRVEAAADGEVSFAGWSDGYGNLLVIKRPDGRETRYGHLEKLLVAAGDEVSAGQEVALSGSTGKSTGPHVHFEIRENGQVVDPTKILTKGFAYNAEK